MAFEIRNGDGGAMTTISGVLRRAATWFADQDAVVGDDRRLSYALLDAEVDKVSRAMIATGLEAGDAVSIWAPNGLDWIVVSYAVYRIGAVLAGRARVDIKVLGIAKFEFPRLFASVDNGVFARLDRYRTRCRLVVRHSHLHDLGQLPCQALELQFIQQVE